MLRNTTHTFSTVHPRLSSPATFVALAAVFIALGGGAYAAIAAIPERNGVIHSCYMKKNGDLRVVPAGKKCGKGERALAFNQKGVRGPQGLPGPTGNTGAPGQPGSIQGASAGGDLTGAFPNPTIAAGAVNTAELADGAVSQQKLANGVTAWPVGAAGGVLTGSYPNPQLAPLPPWHRVGAVGEPPFENGWSSFGLLSGHAPVSFYKDRDGIVHLRGAAQNGSSGCIFQLPAGYRPPYTLLFPSVSQSSGGMVPGRVNVSTDGQVCLPLGFGNVIATVEGIQFRTDS